MRPLPLFEFCFEVSVLGVSACLMIFNFVVIYINLLVTKDGLTAETGLTIQIFHCGIGTSFTLYLHKNDEKK